LSYNSGFSYVKSGIIGAISGSVDEVGNSVAKVLIKGKKVWKDLNYLTMGKYVTEYSKGATIAMKGIGAVGTIGFTAWNVKSSLSKGEYVGAVIDIGFLTGLLITASTPVLLAGAITVGGAALVIGAGVYIDKKATDLKNYYYGR